MEDASLSNLVGEQRATSRTTQYTSAVRIILYVARSAFVLFVLFLASCSPGGGRTGYTSQQQTIDGMTVSLERPQQIAVLQDYEFVVTLADAAGKQIDGATVYLEQDMPGMKMGSNQPLGEPLGNGQYRLKGVFTMDGAWKVVIHASVAGKDYAATFDQQVTPQ